MAQDADFDAELLGQRRPGRQRPAAPPAPPQGDLKARLEDDDFELELAPSEPEPQAPSGGADVAFEELAAMLNEQGGQSPAKPAARPRSGSGRKPAEKGSSRRKASGSGRKARSEAAQTGGSRSASGEAQKAGAKDSGRKKKRRAKTEGDGDGKRRRKRPKDSEAGGKKRKRRRAAPEPEPEPRDDDSPFTECPACFEEVAKAALRCPYCDAAMPRPPSFAETHAGAIQGAKAGAAGLLVLGLCFYAVTLLLSENVAEGRGRERRQALRGLESDSAESEALTPPKIEGAPAAETPKEGPQVAESSEEVKAAAAIKALIAPLKEAQSTEALLAAITKLAADPAGKEACEKTIARERRGELVGRCYRTLYRILKEGELTAALKAGLQCEGLHGVLPAVEVINRGGQDSLADMLSGSATFANKAFKVGRVWFTALKGKLPASSELSTFRIEAGQDMADRLAALRVSAGDGSGLEGALACFDIADPSVCELVQKALVAYTGGEQVLLKDPLDRESVAATQGEWRSVLKTYIPMRSLLAAAASDPNQVFSQGAERLAAIRARRVARAEALAKLREQEGLIAGIATFCVAEPAAREIEGRRILGLLMGLRGEAKDLPVMEGVLAALKDRPGAEHLVAGALRASGSKAVPAALRLAERGLIEYVSLAAVMPDFSRSVGGTEVKNLEARVEGLAAGEKIAGWKILASLGSKRFEELVASKPTTPPSELSLPRCTSKKVEELLLKIAFKEKESEELGADDAARLLANAGRHRIAPKVVSKLRDEELATTAARILQRLARPSDGRKLITAIEKGDSGIARYCFKALRMIRDPKSAGRLAKLYNKTPQLGANPDLVAALIELRYDGRGPRDSLVKEADKWLAEHAEWAKTREGIEPRLGGPIIDKFAKVANRKDAKYFRKAIEIVGNRAAPSAFEAMAMTGAKDQTDLLRQYLLPGRSIRGQAGLALGVLGVEETAEDLSGFLETEEGKAGEADGQILAGLSLLDKKKGAELARKLVSEDRLQANGWAGVVFALARAESTKDLELLQDLATAQDAAVRRSAARGLHFALRAKASAVNPEAFQPLRPLLYDEDPEVRIYATLAALELEPAAARGLVYPLLLENAGVMARRRNDPWTVFLDNAGIYETLRELLVRLTDPKVFFRDDMSEGARREVFGKLSDLKG